MMPPGGGGGEEAENETSYLGETNIQAKKRKNSAFEAPDRRIRRTWRVNAVAGIGEYRHEG